MVALRTGPLIVNVTMVYVKNRSIERETLREELVSIKKQIGDELWLLMGDFNEIRFQTEKEGQGVFKEEARRKYFNDAIEKAEIMELSISRGFFTWSNYSRGSQRVRSKKDRILANNHWFAKWSLVKVELFKDEMSDHVAQITRLRETMGSRKPFHTFNI